MSQAREVLTFQFGNYANFVGAHWWNLQEAGFSYDKTKEPDIINHDVLYRQGVTNNYRTTYTPRLLAVDLDGALKQLPIEGELYGHDLVRNENGERSLEAIQRFKEQIEITTPHAPIEVVSSPEIEPHVYQRDLNNASGVDHAKNYKMSESVDSWADFLYTRYHPRTVHVIRDYKHASEKHGLDTYNLGTELWRSTEFEEDFCDRIRQYVEECDYLQGFQTLFDCDNGFGGLATKCLEHLNDEYGKSNLAVPVYQPRNLLFENADATMSDSIRIVNSALSFQQLIEQASLFTPLSTQERVWRQIGTSRQWPFLQYEGDNLYQTSAILAAYMDTITLRYRLRDSPLTCTLGGLCGDLTNYGRKMAAAALALPFPLQNGTDLIDCLDQYEGALCTSLTPNCKIGTDYVVQVLSVRGIPQHRLKRPREDNVQRQMRMAAYRCERVSEMFQLYLQCSHHASLAHVNTIDSPMPTKLPFPGEIFDARVQDNDFFRDLKQTPDSTPQARVNAVPVVAAMQCSGDIAETLETLHREAKRVKIAKLHRFKAAGLEEEDYQEALELLLLFKDNYDDNYEL